MMRAEILDEIAGVDLTQFGDGLSFGENFQAEQKLTPIEQLLFYAKASKYYYNYTEKRLRKLKINIKELLSPDNCKGVIFNAEDLQEEDTIPITSEQFADKIICHQDFHKVITHDPTTKHYECFYVALSKKQVSEFFTDAKDHLPEMLKPFIGTDEVKPEIFGLASNCTDEDLDIAFEAAAVLISQYLMQKDGELSEIRFTNIGKGIKMDLIQSKIIDPSSPAIQ